jgi:hypothetical protein
MKSADPHRSCSRHVRVCSVDTRCLSACSAPSRRAACSTANTLRTLSSCYMPRIEPLGDTMIRLIAAMLTFGVLMATATTAIAQVRDECLYGSCNPEAPWCRLLCGSDDVRTPRQASPAYSPQRLHHRYPNHPQIIISTGIPADDGWPRSLPFSSTGASNHDLRTRLVVLKAS